MARKKIPRNARCPCGSGKKYKNCCYDKGFDWVEEDGQILRELPLSGELTDMLKDWRKDFIAKHGREPTDDDRIFEDLPHPEHMEHEVVEAMRRAGLDPALIYAYEQTGRLVTEQNQQFLTEAELAEWDAAIEEYEQQQDLPEFPIGTVAIYGPDDKTTTKMAAGIFFDTKSEPIIQRWVSSDVLTNPKIQQEMEAFFAEHGVTQIAMTEDNIGCPHEEGEDFPIGGDCPFCPYWKGKQGSKRREERNDWF